MTKPLPFPALSRAISRAFCSSSSSSSSSSSFPFKHVTKSNFASSLADIARHVSAADFIAIDMEMSGVTSAPWRESLEFDRYDVSYLKVKDSAEKFAVLQFGVCPFRWDPLRSSFTAHPHNFFVFPNEGISSEFLCQTSSLEFLAKCQFDFNTCINEGVSYLSRAQEVEALRRLNSRYEDESLDLWHNSRDIRDARLVGVTDILFSERMKNRLYEWREELLRDRNVKEFHLNESNQPFETIFYKMRPALRLNGFTPHQHRLIKLVTKKHFKDLAYIHTNGENSSSEHLVVYTESEGDKNLLMKEVKGESLRAAQMKIKASIGLRSVIDLLSCEKKLIVGHNCFLDFAHIYSKFLSPLPFSAEEFVCSVNKCFPYIVDTKLMLNSNNLLRQRMRKSATSLSSAFSLLCRQVGLSVNPSSDLGSSVKVEIEVDDTRSSNWNSGVKHEAGYDAFMTGCLFAQSCSHIGIDFKLHSPSDNLADNELLQKHVNHLYLSWKYGDIIDLSSGKRTVEYMGSNRLKNLHSKIVHENTILIWRSPSIPKAGEIKDCISKVFGFGSVTTVYRVDETAAFVQFSKAELVSDFLALKESLEKSNNAITVLHPLSKILQGGNTCAASYETYKEICSSPISETLLADQAEASGIRWKTKMLEQQAKMQESSENTGSTFVERSMQEKELPTCDPSSDHEEVIDSFFPAEFEQVRATKL